jgi:hypothetical protein
MLLDISNTKSFFLNIKTFIMSIFNFFRKSEKEVNNAVETIDPALFVDAQAPEESVQPREQSALSIFLEGDYSYKGFNDGYVHHNGEILEATLRKLRSDFRKVLDREIDLKREEISSLRLHMIDTHGISERLELGLMEKIRQLENLLSQLDLQKTLSIEDEGLVSSVLHDYRIGFIKGVEQFNQEKFIGASTGLF